MGVAVCAVSSGSIFARLSGAPPVLIALGRCLFAAVVFLIWSSFRPVSYRLTTGDRWRMVGAGAALGVHLATWIASLSLTTVGVSVLLVNTTPVWVLLLSRQRPAGRDLAAIVLAFAGCAVAVSGSLGGHSSLLGAALALLGGVAMAVYVLLGKRLIERMDLVHYVAGCYGSAAACLLLVALVMRPPVLSLPLAAWGWVLAMAVCAQMIGHTLVNRSLGPIAPHRVTLALMMEPLLASLAAWAVFGEMPTWQLAAAFPLVLVGVGLVVLPRSDRA